MLPILHLNGYKINNPTLLARISHEELENLFKGYGWTPHFVEGDDPRADAPEDGCDAGGLRPGDPRAFSKRPAPAGKRQSAALADDRAAQPERLDRAEGSRRPQGGRLLARAPGAARRRRDNPAASEDRLEDWLRSYKPEELFDESGRLIAGAEGACPSGRRGA